MVDNPFVIDGILDNYDVEISKPLINMVDFARRNIDKYDFITEIPKEYMPYTIEENYDYDVNWSGCFGNCINLKNLPSPFYSGWENAVNISDAFYSCVNLTGSIPNIPNSVIDMRYAFFNCYNLTGSIPNIPNNVTDMSYAFYGCCNLSSSNVYIHSNNVYYTTYCFYNMSNTMNIYVHAGTNTYNAFYKAMGNSTYNAEWNCYLKSF